MVKISKIVLIILFLCFSAKSVFAASLFATPTSGTFNVGDKVTLKIMVSSDLPINAISSTISFPSIFLIESISKSSSILNFWVTEPNFSKGAGILQFEGVSLGGFSQGTGNVLTVVLKANKEGSGNISFKSGQILANDGQGTDLTGDLRGSSFLVKPKIDEPAKILLEKEDAEKEEILIEEQKLPTLIPPQISLEKINGEEIISGNSVYKNSKVLLTFTNDIDTKIFLLGDTDLNGKFSFSLPKALKYGFYKVNATLIKEDLTHSVVSNEIVVKIGNIFSDISVEIKISIILLILLTTYLIIRIIFLFRKDNRKNFFNKKALKEAEEVVRKSFKILNEDVKRDFPKRMTIAEQKNKEEIKEDLNDAEDVILKEIKDMEK